MKLSICAQLNAKRSERDDFDSFHRAIFESFRGDGESLRSL